MVGTTGFEPTTSSTPRKRATKLRYVPNECYYNTVLRETQDKIFERHKISVGKSMM